MAYCAETDIESLILADITASTKPTSTQLSGYIDQFSAEIDVALTVANISLPVSDASFLLMLKRYCSIGVAGLVLMTYAKEFENVGGGLANAFYTEYKEFIKDVTNNPNKYASMLSATANYYVSNNIDAGITDEQDLLGNTVEW